MFRQECHLSQHRRSETVTMVKLLNMNNTFRFIINRGGQNKRGGGGLKDFEKLINERGQNKGGEPKYKRKKTKIGLSLLTLLTSLNISISSTLQSLLR